MTTKSKQKPNSKEGRLQDLLGELKTKTLDPALKDAAKVKSNAQAFADQLIEDARCQKEQLIKEAEKEITQKKKIFQKALESAKRQAVDQLRSEIESGIFNPEIRSILEDVSNETKIVVSAVETLVKAASTCDQESEYKAYISTAASPEEVAKGIGKALMKRLDGKIHPLKSLKGGAQLRVEKESMVLDLSSEVISDLISTYIRAELRGFLFGQEMGG